MGFAVLYGRHAKPGAELLVEGRFGVVTQFTGNLNYRLLCVFQQPLGAVHTGADQQLPQAHAVVPLQDAAELPAGDLQLGSQILHGAVPGGVSLDISVDFIQQILVTVVDESGVDDRHPCAAEYADQECGQQGVEHIVPERI